MAQGITIVAPIPIADRFPFERNAQLLARSKVGFHSFVPWAHLTICGVVAFEENELSDEQLATLESIATDVVVRIFSKRQAWRVAFNRVEIEAAVLWGGNVRFCPVLSGFL